MHGNVTRRQFCVGALLAPSLAASVAEPPRKWAVLVGVSALRYTPSKSLVGPLNDVPQMREILTAKYGFAPDNITTLEGEQATRANIVRTMETLAQTAQAGDFVLLYYSGHGTLSSAPPDYPDPNQQFKAFVPHDAQLTHGRRLDNGLPCPGIAIGCEGGEKCDGSGEPRWETLLQNRDVTALLRALPTRDVLVILDCCHSGIAARGGAVARRWVTAKTKSSRDTPVSAPADTREGLTTLAACTADQTAKEWPFLAKTLGPNAPHEGKMGALTYYLLEHLRGDAGGTTTGAQALAQVSSALLASDFSQTPEAEGYLSRPLFGPLPIFAAAPKGAISETQLVVTSVSGKQARVQGSAGALLTQDSIFADAQSDSILRITASTGSTASAAVLAGNPATGQSLREMLRPVPVPRLRVAVFPASEAARSASAEVAQSIASLSGIALVPDRAAPHEVEAEVTASPNGVSVTLYRGQVQLPFVFDAVALKDVAPKIGPALENLLALQLLTELENTHSNLGLQIAVNGQAAATVPIGSQITLTARASRDCYLYLVDMDPQGKVTVLFPNRFVRDNHLKAGETYALPAPQLYRLTVQGPAGPEIVKAIATTHPIALSAFASDTGTFAPLSTDAAAFARDLVLDLQRAVTIPENGITPALTAAAGNTSFIASTGWASATLRLQVTQGH